MVPLSVAASRPFSLFFKKRVDFCVEVCYPVDVFFFRYSRGRMGSGFLPAAYLPTTGESGERLGVCVPAEPAFFAGRPGLG